MSARKYFGTDGIRGRVGSPTMSPDFILKLGWAAGRVLAANGGKKVLIGKDTRISGYMFESALQAGLSAAGVNIQLLGPMPTPAVAYLTRTLRADAGIVISASHNPYYDNGIKFFSRDGMKLPDSVELGIEAMLDKPMDSIASRDLGKARRVTDAAGRYIEFCKASVPSGLDLAGLKIVVDCANGATYHIAPNVFRELGAEVIELATEPDGLNINLECGSTHPATLRAAVLHHGADVGVAFDGDGDRVLLIDGRGEILDGDEILYLIAQDRLRQGLPVKGVAGTQMTNLGLETVLKEAGIPFGRAKVGDRYVLEMLQQNGWDLGGESSGHIICLDKNTTGDGIVAALQVLSYVVGSGKSLQELRGGYHVFPQCLVNVSMPYKADLTQMLKVHQLVAEIEGEMAGTGRILLRASGTEPLIRVMVEGRDEVKVSEYANKIADAVRDSLN